MNNNNTYYQRNKKILIAKAQNCVIMKLVRKKQKNIMKVIKKGCQKKPKINRQLSNEEKDMENMEEY